MTSGLQLVVNNGRPARRKSFAACRACREPIATAGFTVEGVLLVLPHSCPPPRRLSPGGMLLVAWAATLLFGLLLWVTR